MRKRTEAKAVRFNLQIYQCRTYRGLRILLVTAGMAFLLSTVTVGREQAQSFTALDGGTGDTASADGSNAGIGQQESQAADAPSAEAPARRRVHLDPEGRGRIGAGVRMSTLGAGGEVAVALTHTTNIRGGFNFFRYSRGYDNNGIHYAGDLQWASAEAHFDWFPFGHAFHLSPGLMVYNDNHVNATASIPGGQTFTLDNTSYLSSPANPVGGTAKLYFTKVDPTVMIGFGNLVPRNGSHFSVNFEVGVAFEGSPMINLNLNGTACAPDGTNCQNIQTTPSIQTNIQGERAKLVNDLAPFKYYPLMSLTIGYRF